MNIEKKSFRKAKTEDLDRIMEIEEASFDTPWSREALKMEIERDLISEVYVVEVPDEDGNGKVVGFLNFVKLFGEVHINNVAIDEDYRNLGIGSFLLSNVLKELGNNGFGNWDITLEVRHDNFPAINLYKKFGFVEEGMRKDYYKIGSHAIIMWKR
ncbi:ribosomal protein S18-alanine N-acetyltransferase [Anaerosphaera multitolerans]|uniref:[Ribosomal protein bS18]-alanine N-acetyltransferase n=1 Tax=Anaerosphaera multitolerans TaxID=2487351 RepID=A0A437S7L7_9FIRM|nr:ribosomal protein S18-alanine N-acetyltransferase [Anaerosphaera multitolerans]RVU55056.1 ribosomal-protein-alanine N-acetyltransferase [Anaerosphaera multitolerans]